MSTALSTDSINWDTAPELLSRHKFCTLCRVENEAVNYLLLTGKIPCEYHGRFKIRKETAKKFLADKERSPEKYKVPRFWYKSRYVFIKEGELAPFAEKKMSEYYTDLLADQPDVIPAAKVVKLIGYAKTTINGWCDSGEIKSFRHGRANYIPKQYLVQFLCSPRCRSITRKTPWHAATLENFPFWEIKPW